MPPPICQQSSINIKGKENLKGKLQNWVHPIQYFNMSLLICFQIKTLGKFPYLDYTKVFWRRLDNPWLSGKCLFFFLSLIGFFFFLRIIYFFGCSRSQLWHWSLVPNQGSNLGLLHWEHRVSATELWGKSLLWLFVLTCKIREAWWLSE